MVATIKQSGNAPRPPVPGDRPGGGSRDPQVQASDLAVRFGVLRGVRAHASDPLSRALRRVIYLPGV